MEITTDHTFRTEKKRVWLAAIPALVFCVIVWLTFLIDYTQIFSFNFSLLGIYPRRANGLVGILFSPFVHTSFSHLISNTIPLVVLFSILFFFYSRIAFKTSAFLWFMSGLFTWLIGRSSYHVGASGLIFAFAFFIFFSGLFRKHIPLTAVSMVVAFVYGGTVWSIFPIAEYIDSDLSWEAHLSGAIAGLAAAFIFRKEGPQKPETFWEEEEEFKLETTKEDEFLTQIPR